MKYIGIQNYMEKKKNIYKNIKIYIMKSENIYFNLIKIYINI